MLGLVSIGVLVMAFSSQASSVSFYPTSCLGTWEDARKAQGRPEAASVDGIGPDNAAMLERRSQDLYCGSFEGGEIPAEAAVRAMSLSLVWRLSDERVEAVKVVLPADDLDGETASTSPSAEEEVLSGALDTLSPASAEYEIVPDPVTDENPESVPVEEKDDEQAPEAVEESVETQQGDASPPAEEPVSFSWIATAIAQEVDGTPPEAVEEAPASVEESGDTGAEATSSLPGQDEAGSDTPQESDAASLTRGALLYVDYSLDGATWTRAKDVTRANWQEPIDLAGMAWEDVARLQVRVSRADTVDIVPFFYLDAIELVAEYDEEGMEMPDFEKDVPLSIRSNDRFVLLSVLRETDNRQVLWLFERTESPQWRIIASGDSVQADSPIALSGSHAFWMSADGRAIVGYDISAGTTFSRTVERASQGGLELPFADDELVAVRATGGILIRDVLSGETRGSDDDAAYSAGFWGLGRENRLGPAVSPVIESVVSEPDAETGEIATSTPESLVEPAEDPIEPVIDSTSTDDEVPAADQEARS